MDVIKSGLETIRGGSDCPCICARGTGGFRGADTMALDGGGCGCNCNIDCLYPVTLGQNMSANSTLAWNS
jgi:hypothetical protein